MRDYPSRHLLFDPVSRDRKARKILRILHDHLEYGTGSTQNGAGASSQVRARLREFRCLDVGCASGLISSALGEAFRHVVAVDVDADALTRGAADARNGLSFVLSDAMELPFSDGGFDLVVCSQVYEHVSFFDQAAREIWRVLRPGGICFFSGPNKLDPIERHYGLPMIHWMPRRLAGALLRLTGRGESYEERPLTYWSLRQTLGEFRIHDFTVEMILDPARYYCTDEVPERSWARRVPRSVWRKLVFLLPNYNWVLVKPEAGFRPANRLLWPGPGKM